MDEPTKTDNRPADIYRQIMLWLEGKLPTQTNQTLVVPIKGGDKVRELRFRRVVGMNAIKWAESIDNPLVQIHYDPNWDVLERIAGLIAAAEVK